MDGPGGRPYNETRPGPRIALGGTAPMAESADRHLLDLIRRHGPLTVAVEVEIRSISGVAGRDAVTPVGVRFIAVLVWRARQCRRVSIDFDAEDERCDDECGVQHDNSCR